MTNREPFRMASQWRVTSWFEISRYARYQDWESLGRALGDIWTWAEDQALFAHCERPWKNAAWSVKGDEDTPFEDIPF